MFGTIRYAGPGLFLAGGIGVAPMLAILRQLKKDHTLEGNTLIYSARFHIDLIAERELRQMLGNNLHITLTKEQREGYHHSRIIAELLQNILPFFPSREYIIGSELFVDDMRSLVADLRKK